MGLLTSILDEYIPEGSENPLKDLGESVRRWRQSRPCSRKVFPVHIEVGNLDVYREGGELKPSRKTTPLTVVANKASIEGILPRLVSVQDGAVFDTEHRNLPMVFRICLGVDSQLVTRFEADKSNIIEATRYWRLLKEFEAVGRLSFIEPNTGETLFKCTKEADPRQEDCSQPHVSPG